MGDRANIKIVNSVNDVPMYFYSHWGGSYLPSVVKRALAREERWSDCQYLARIIFDEMTKDAHGETTGYGLSTYIGDGGERIITVNMEEQIVELSGEKYSFYDYIELSEETLIL